MTQAPFQNVTDMMKKFSENLPKIDREAMLKSHRKNVEALTEANKTAVEVMKSIVQLQSQYVKQVFDDVTTVMQDFTKGASPLTKEGMGKVSTHLKNHVENGMAHGANIANKLVNSQKEIFEIMQGRFQDSTKEMTQMQKKTKETKH